MDVIGVLVCAGVYLGACAVLGGILWGKITRGWDRMK